MITEVRTKKMVVISDIHLGSPFCRAKRQAVDFFYWAAGQGYDVCINGDGIEIAQVSFSKVACDVPEVLHALKVVAKLGVNTYYVVGNHDMPFENFLDDWGGLKMAPFLNVLSGGKRIRVEHGHLYDPFFVKHPQLYEYWTLLGGLCLSIYPGCYRPWMRFEEWRASRRSKQGETIRGEPPSFALAALELARRGFDAVVFGHTHLVGKVNLGDGRSYYNAGSWMIDTDYIEIQDGEVTLRHWSADCRENAESSRPPGLMRTS